MPQPTLISSPQTLSCLRQGFDELATLLALTLGPTQGVVLNDRGNKSPEMLTDFRHDCPACAGATRSWR